MNNTLANGLTLLAFLSGTAEAYSVTELAQHLDLPKSHVHRLLQTLVGMGYCLQDEDRRYRIGLEPLVISKALLAHHPLRQVARVHLHRVAEATGLDTLIAIPHRASTALVLGVAYPGGEQRDAATAIGNLLRFPTTASCTLFAVVIPGFADASVFADDVRADIAARDQALKDPANASEVNGLTTAIRDADGQVVACLGISGPRTAFADDLDRLRAIQAEAAAAIATAYTARSASA